MHNYRITLDVFFSAPDSDAAYALADRMAGTLSDEGTHIVTGGLSDIDQTEYYFRKDDTVLPMPEGP